MLGAGFWFARVTRSGSDFFVGGNRIPWWAAGVSLYMTTFSAWMFTGAASFVYNTGWFGFLYFAVKPLGFIVGFLLAAVKWRRARIQSPVEYVEERYNHTTRLVLSVVLVISMMYWPGHHLASVAKISAPALFPDMPFAVDGLILFFGVFVLLYSVAGGIWAVSMTDVLQFVVLLSVCVVLLVAIFGSGEVGTIAEAVAAVPAVEWNHSFRPGTVYTPWYIVGFVVAGVFGNVVGDKAQRFFMVQDERAARKTGWLAFALFLTSPILFGIPPLIGKVLWPEMSQLVAFAGESKPDEAIFIAVVMKFLPAGVVGLFIAAMVAASMSALDSVWNTVSAIVSVDLYKGHLRPDATDRELLVVGRVVVAVLAVSAVTMALLIVHSELGIFTISNIVLGLVGIPVTVPLLVGLISKRPVTWSAIPSILAGIVVAAVARFALDWTLGPQYIAVVATSLLVLLTSRWLGRAYIHNRVLAFVAVCVTTGVLFLVVGLISFPTMADGVYNRALSSDGFGGGWLAAAMTGIAFLVGLFAPLFGRDSKRPVDRAVDRQVDRAVDRPVAPVDTFFARLDRPIDVSAELGEDNGVARPNRIIAWACFALAVVPVALSLVHGTDNLAVYLSLAAILLLLGIVFLKVSVSRASVIIIAIPFAASLATTPAGAQVRMNELMAANDTTIADPDFGRFADWVELHNTGAVAVSLDGFTLTDDPAIPNRWAFPNGTSVAAGAYLLVWLDGRDTGLHASFALDRDGEYIGLFDPSGSAADSLTFGGQYADVSYGREPATSEWRYYAAPTPGTANGSGGFAGVLPGVAMTPAPGFYFGGETVALSSGDSLAAIRYTTDGTPPDSGSAEYETPLVLDGQTVLRAAAFRDGFITGPVTTGSYLQESDPGLPVVSLVTDPDHLFSDESGIYVKGTNGVSGYCRRDPHNWNQDWERPIHIEVFERDGSLGLAMNAGVKIFGGCTRIYNQKSLAIFARSVYGDGDIDYQLFPDRPFDSFESVVLRSSAQDWWRTMFRDAMIQSLIRAGMDVETQAYRPVIVYVNGDYWGIHNLREKLNEHYFAAHFEVEPDAIEILQNDDQSLQDRRSPHYAALLDYLEQTDLEVPGAMDPVHAAMDVDNFIDYSAAQIFVANADWPGNNIKLWRPLQPDGRWRWAVFDVDMGYGGNAHGQTTTNNLALATSTQNELWSNPPWSTFMLRKLLTNSDFRNRFMQRYATHVSTTFESGHVLAVIDSLRDQIAPEIPRHKARWPKSISFTSTWEEGIDIMRDFARHRPGHARSHFYEKFGLEGAARLTIEVVPEGAGTVHIEDLPIDVRKPAPILFRGVPTNVRATPAEGYYFVGWEGASDGTDPELSLVLTANTTLRAVFAPGSTPSEEAANASEQFTVWPPFPNPAGTRGAWLEVELAVPASVSVELFDLLGRRLRPPATRELPSGRHRLQVKTGHLASGVYLVRVRGPGRMFTHRLTVGG